MQKSLCFDKSFAKITATRFMISKRNLDCVKTLQQLDYYYKLVEIMGLPSQLLSRKNLNFVICTKSFDRLRRLDLKGSLRIFASAKNLCKLEIELFSLACGCDALK